MNRTESTKDKVWQSFKESFEEITNLQNELYQILAQESAIRQKIEAKKLLLEGAANLPWDNIQAVLVQRPAKGHDGSDSVSSVMQKGAFKEGGTRMWVLKAIAHYEDNNRESHINERSIRIYINTQSPGFLEDCGEKIIYCALSALRKKGLVKMRSKSHAGQSQYALTPLGRQVLSTQTERWQSHG